MVKLLSKADREIVAEAIAAVERVTSVELIVVVAPASDAYQDYALLYGLIIGSCLDLGLWATKAVTSFPLLLAIQLIAMTLPAVVPWLRHACLPCVPKRIRHHRAAQRACEEYLTVSRRIPGAAPIALLYISLAERYAHVVTSRQVRERVADEQWDRAVLQAFTHDVRKFGVRESCISAINRMTELVAPAFPERGEAHVLNERVIEIEDGQ